MSEADPPASRLRFDLSGALIVMAFKLLLVAEGHWRRIDTPELVPLVRAGVYFEDGVQVEPQKKKAKKAAA